MVAPASKASCALSICSAMVIGTAGLLAFRGRLPVIATQMMHGLVITGPLSIGASTKSKGERHMVAPPSTRSNGATSVRFTPKTVSESR